MSQSLFKEEGGQATVEYVLMTAIAIMALGLLGKVFRKLAFALWETITYKVTGPSPTAPGPNNFKLL